MIWRRFRGSNRPSARRLGPPDRFQRIHRYRAQRPGSGTPSWGASCRWRRTSRTSETIRRASSAHDSRAPLHPRGCPDPLPIVGRPSDAWRDDRRSRSGHRRHGSCPRHDGAYRRQAALRQDRDPQSLDLVSCPSSPGSGPYPEGCAPYPAGRSPSRRAAARPWRARRATGARDAYAPDRGSYPPGTAGTRRVRAATRWAST
jgi:hypothetical protein